MFGKTMEDVRSRIRFDITTENEEDDKREQTLFNDVAYKIRTYINENITKHDRYKQTMQLNKPISIGATILDLSKQHMYSFYYDVLKPKYGDNIRVGYTDTDSFI
jgi:hypothetical protein